MNAEHPSIDHSSQAEIIEYVAAISPDVDATIFSLTFIIESVNLSNLARLVVSPDKCNPVGIPNLEQ
jgi:hypothetical protein